MNCLALATLLVLCPSAPAFESSGTLSHWDLLDYNGDARIERVTVEDCPPGYGPEVTRLSGSLALLLAKGGHLADGTYVALYRERAAATEDADGVILFGGAYGDDLALEHNTKAMRPHVWLEQDNDTGISFRFAPVEGEDYALAEAVAEGLVSDAWNVTGWIWQKVAVEGEVIKAKYWPAHTREPAEWALEHVIALPGDRFGIRINSGAIDLAWFAASPVDITIPAPVNYLYLPRSSVAEGESLAGTVFTFRESPADGPLRYAVVDSESNTVAQADLQPAAAGEGAIPFEIDTPLPQGTYLLRITPEKGDGAVERTIEVGATSDLVAALQSRAAVLADLAQISHGSKALTEVQAVASGLLDHARSLHSTGKSEAAEATLRFVDETLADLHGPAGAELHAHAPDFDWASIPTGYVANTGAGDPKHGVTDYYRMNSRLHFGAVACAADSLVMGQTYSFRIPFEVRGEAPADDFTLHVAIRDPLGIRTVAEATIQPDPPTSQWQPGATYGQTFELAIPRDGDQKGVSQPIILDERHDLLVSVRHPESSSRVLLDNAPGGQPDRIGNSYRAGQFHISSDPVELRGFQLQPAPEGDTLECTVANHGDERSCVVRLRYLAPSGKTILEQAQPVALDPESETPVIFAVNGRHRGDVTAELSLWEGGRRLTEAVREVPAEGTLSYQRQNHVEYHHGALRTPVHVQSSTWPDPVDVTFQAAGETLATFEGIQEDTTLYPPPHFGYYDIVATNGDTTWHHRIVATVVEVLKGQLLVNGEPFIVKGVNVHSMDSRSPARTRLMMEILKDLGFNSLRGDYPPRWQLDMAHEVGLTYDVLAPFSVSSTTELFARQDGPPLATARALTRQFIARYQDSAAALLWNSCNEITDENIPFLLGMYPLYSLHDPYNRPVHYANLYGQDLWQGQDLMGVNYYFADTQRAKDRQPLIARSATLAREHGRPLIYTEFNSYHGAVPTTGVEALEDLFLWGVEEQGMAGGYFYMMPNSDRHPGVFDSGYNTHAIMDDAFHRAFDDAEVRVVETGERGPESKLEIQNKRPFALRKLSLDLTVGGQRIETPPIPDIPAKQALHVPIYPPESALAAGRTYAGALTMETHHGLWTTMPFEIVYGG